MYAFPEKWYFLKVCRLAKGLRILQVSINLYFSRCCIVLEFDFFFKVGLLREDSKFELQKKNNSPVKKALL